MKKKQYSLIPTQNEMFNYVQGKASNKKYATLSFGLIGLYRLKFYMHYFLRIYTVHFKNI